MTTNPSQTLSKNKSEHFPIHSISSIFIKYKTRLQYCNERKPQTNISYECRSKIPQQNISKLTSAKYRKLCIHEQEEFFIGI